MPGFDTAATIISDVARELGLVTSAVADPFASSDQNVLLLTVLLKPTGREIVRLHPWSHLQREATFNTVNGTPSYALATDFGRFLDATMWNRTQADNVPGSLTPQQWQQTKAWTSLGVFKTLRLWGDLLYLDPTPTAAEAIYYEYISRNWGAAAFAKDVPTAATDVVQFDPHLFGRALKLRFLQAKGFDTTAALDDFNDALSLAKGQDGAAPTLSLHPGRIAPWPNVPETGFGQ